MDEIRVQVRFTKQAQEGLNFSDALYFTLDEWDVITPEQLETLKDERFNNWLEVLNIDQEVE